MAKRSPILGYNHNVRHRGLIFHVQTEDSGMGNPHLFTHLFHGGVIISTRKLTYDNGSAEESIKALMQAQHKAVLKDLKACTFDAKIDAYLAGTPGLEPSTAGTRGRRDTMVSAPPPELDQMMDDQVTPPAGSSLTEAVLAKAVPQDPPEVPHPAPPIVSGSTPMGRGRGDREDDVSAAFRAIAPNDDALLRAGDAVPSQIDDGETTPTPHIIDPSLVPAPGAARPSSQSDGVPQQRAGRDTTPSGSYAQHNVHRTDKIPIIHDAATQPIPRKRDQTGSRPPPLPPLAPVGSRPPPLPPARAAGKPHAPAGPPPRAAGKPTGGVSASVVPPGGTPQQPRTGVVVSRPAVIIGGPPKVVGARDADAARGPAGRRAREEPTRPNLFGKDLISEKSLDEVILAYLSEDSAEE